MILNREFFDSLHDPGLTRDVWATGELSLMLDPPVHDRPSVEARLPAPLNLATQVRRDQSLLEGLVIAPLNLIGAAVDIP